MKRIKGEIEAATLTNEIQYIIDDTSLTFRKILRMNIVDMFYELESTNEEVDHLEFSVERIVRYFDEYASALTQRFYNSLNDLYRDWLDFRGREKEERIGRRLSMGRVRGKIDIDSFMGDIEIIIRDTLDSFMESLLRNISDMFDKFKYEVGDEDLSEFSTLQITYYLRERFETESSYLEGLLSRLYVRWVSFLKRRDEEEAERRRWRIV